jgi:hypothetical protein
LYLLYIGESGYVEDAADRHLHAHLSTIELHAQWMRKGKGGWRSIPAAVRTALLRALCDLLGDRQRELIKFAPLFAVVRSPEAGPVADPLERCFEELFLRFTQMLIRVGKRSPEWGIVVADEAKYETAGDRTVEECRDAVCPAVPAR